MPQCPVAVGATPMCLREILSYVSLYATLVLIFEHLPVTDNTITRTLNYTPRKGDCVIHWAIQYRI